MIGHRLGMCEAKVVSRVPHLAHLLGTGHIQPRLPSATPLAMGTPECEGEPSRLWNFIAGLSNLQTCVDLALLEKRGVGYRFETGKFGTFRNRTSDPTPPVPPGEE